MSRSAVEGSTRALSLHSFTIEGTRLAQVMTVITNREDDKGLLANAFADASRIAVISLCAAWCDTCNDFRSGYELLAQSRPDVIFVWLDIEDDAEAVGDVDVEDFPTLAIFRGTQPLHFGVSLPHPPSIGRLIDALAAQSQPLQEVPEAVAQLPQRLLASSV